MAAREVLTGAVLELHQQAERRPTLLTTGPACNGCAHRVAGQYAGFDECGRSVWYDPVTGAPGHLHCTVERTSARADACGLNAIHFVPTADFLAARSARRLVQQERLQEAIAQFQPDTTAALELIGSVKRALADRYGEHRLTAVDEAVGEVEEALADLERELADQ